MSAAENVGLPMVLDGALSASEIERRATQLLERVGMGARTQHVPSQLSGGVWDSEMWRMRGGGGDADADAGLTLGKMINDLFRDAYCSVVSVGRPWLIVWLSARMHFGFSFYVNLSSFMARFLTHI